MKKIHDIIIRYIILIIVAIPNLYIFYLIFTPLTIYPIYFLLNIFFNTTLTANTITIFKCSSAYFIEIIPACVAGAAYYLLLILNLSTPNIKLKKRIKLIITAFLALLILNILRIFFMSILHISGSEFFAITHQLFWYLGSTLLVIAIWFTQVKLFKIKQIPFYSDIKYLYKQTRKRK